MSYLIYLPILSICLPIYTCLSNIFIASSFNLWKSGQQKASFPVSKLSLSEEEERTKRIEDRGVAWDPDEDSAKSWAEFVNKYKTRHMKHYIFAIIDNGHLLIQCYIYIYIYRYCVCIIVTSWLDVTCRSNSHCFFTLGTMACNTCWVTPGLGTSPITIPSCLFSWFPTFFWATFHTKKIKNPEDFGRESTKHLR